nr:hypothetical protein [Microbacterium caowuchunii]
MSAHTVTTLRQPARDAVELQVQTVGAVHEHSEETQQRNAVEPSAEPRRREQFVAHRSGGVSSTPYPYEHARSQHPLERRPTHPGGAEFSERHEFGRFGRAHHAAIVRYAPQGTDALDTGSG